MRSVAVLEAPLGPVDPQVQREAMKLLEVSHQQTPKPLSLKSGSTYLHVPEALSEFLMEVIGQLASDCAVGVFTLPEELTTTTAARQLGISRPTLMKLINKGGIASYKVGTHTRLKRSDVMEYLENRAAQRRAALAELLEAGDAYPN